MAETTTSLLGQLNQGLDQFPLDSPFIKTKRNGEWHEMDINTFRDKVKYLAFGLHSLGVGRGDKVSLHAENSAEWLICDLAILTLGAACVPIYATQPGEQIKYIIENSEAKVHIVSTDELFAETKAIIKPVESVTAIISIYGSKHKKLKTLDDVIEMGRKKETEAPDFIDESIKKIEPDDLATLIYTSGTTGLPKGVMLTHNNLSTNLSASLTRVPFTYEEIKGRNVLSYLPLSHIFERIISYMYLCMQARIHYIQVIDEIKDDFLYVKPYFFATVPRLLEKVYTGIKVKGQEFSGVKKQLYYWALNLTENYDPENPSSGLGAVKRGIADKLIYSKMRELFGGELTGVVTGGAALPPEIFRFMNAIGIFCGQGYGLTETSPVISVQDRKHLRVGSSGVAIEDVEVKIAEDGEIWSRGPNVMKGYYKLPDQTAEVLTDDGWFKTGDIGRLDEDGYVYITDRKKALFKLSTGKYVAPQNVENQISGSGFIEQILVVGDEKKFCSALIVPSYENVKKRLKRDGITPSEPLSEDDHINALIQSEVDKLNKPLAKWEQVKKFKLLGKQFTIEAGDLTPTMKVKRSVVREKYRAEIDSMYQDEES